MTRLEELENRKRECELEISKEMTREKIKVMQAFVDGKTIEFIDKLMFSDWKETSSPTWDWLRDSYKIKEETNGE